MVSDHTTDHGLFLSLLASEGIQEQPSSPTECATLACGF